MFEIGILLLGVFGTLVVAKDWIDKRDLFYPTIYIVPMCLFFYVVFPIVGVSADEEQFFSFGGGEDALGVYQCVALLVIVSLVAGIQVGSRGRRTMPGRKLGSASIYTLATVIGIAGFSAWLYTIEDVGGFESAYGRAYGGGWAESGYMREAMFAGVLSAPMIILARRSRGMRVIDWVLVLLVIAPVLIQGIFGARRGPTFLALVSVIGAYILVFRVRVGFLPALTGSVAIGLLLLLLITNRDAIYLGAELSEVQEAWTYLRTYHSNEYLYGSALHRYVEATGDDFNGLRIVAHLIGKIVPAGIWPTIYEDLDAVFQLETDLTLNAGVPVQKVASVVGWQAAVGAAPGLVGDIWLEFGWSSPIFAFAVGCIYGLAWRVSAMRPSMQFLSLILAALSIYLVSQSIEAWLYRLFLLGLPGYVVLRLFEGGAQVSRSRALRA